MRWAVSVPELGMPLERFANDGAMAVIRVKTHSPPAKRGSQRDSGSRLERRRTNPRLNSIPYASHCCPVEDWPERADGSPGGAHVGRKDDVVPRSGHGVENEEYCRGSVCIER